MIEGGIAPHHFASPVLRQAIRPVAPQLCILSLCICTCIHCEPVEPIPASKLHRVHLPVLIISCADCPRRCPVLPCRQQWLWPECRREDAARQLYYRAADVCIAVVYQHMLDSCPPTAQFQRCLHLAMWHHSGWECGVRLYRHRILQFLCRYGLRRISQEWWQPYLQPWHGVWALFVCEIGFSCIICVQRVS